MPARQPLGEPLQAVAEPTNVSEEETLRADLYDYLSALLARPPATALLERTANLEGDDSTELGRAIRALSRVAAHTTERGARSEFDRLFIGLGRGELVPYASYYMTGFLHEKPLALLRDDMRRHGIRREETVKEPEDGIASLCEMMAGLIRGRFGRPMSVAGQKEFFGRHLSPWAGHFFTDLERAKGSVLYAPVGSVGRIFMNIERDAFRLAGGEP
jgi:TorA maturation chaperone TorD